MPAQRVEQYNGVPPYPETQSYVKRVTSRYQQAKKKTAAARQPICYRTRRCRTRRL